MNDDMLDWKQFADSKSTLSEQERTELRTLLIGERASKALHFQNVAVRHLGPAAGIFCRQLLFWDGRGMDPNFWIYKSIGEWQQETGLSRRQQARARKVLNGKGLMQEKMALGPDRRRRLFYRLNLGALKDLMYEELAQPDSQGPNESADDFDDIPF